MDVQCMVSTGGTSLRDDVYRLYRTVHILVGTPGRILDLASKNLCNLENISMLIMDEADKLLSPDFSVVVEKVLGFGPADK
mmetsp:Transcript_31039/g.5596  ORF Transcript_31039/g.5596 Transcript_31039/m.5596 type:complete len:81 (+) Transcript_31039:388-630(+)